MPVTFSLIESGSLDIRLYLLYAAVAVVLVGVHIVFFGQRCLKSKCQCFLQQRICSRFVLLFDVKWIEATSSKDPIEQNAWARLQKALVNRLLNVLPMATQVSFVILISILTVPLVSPIQMSFNMITHATLMLMNAFPQTFVTYKSLPLLYSYFMLMCAVSNFEAPLGTLLNDGTLLTARIITSLFVLHIPCCIFWNVVYSTTKIYMYVYSDDLDESIMSVNNYVTREVLTSVMHILILHRWKIISLAECRQFVLASDARSERAAQKMMLNAVCDVVVQLDKDLRILGEAPQLAGMLAHGEGRSLNGQEFVRFMPSSDDQQLFTKCSEYMPSAPDHIADAIHVSMRDSLGISIDVELFHVHILEYDEHVGHLVGIRECGVEEQSTCIPDAKCKLEGSNINNSAISEENEASNSIARCEVSLIVFNVTSYVMHDWSSDFAGLCGTDPSQQNFRRWVLGDSSFLMRLQHNVNIFVYDATCDESEAVEYGKILLCIPRLASMPLYVKAECSIVLSTSSNDRGKEMVAIARFKNFIPVRGDSKECRRAHRNYSSQSGQNSRQLVASRLGQSSNSISTAADSSQSKDLCSL